MSTELFEEGKIKVRKVERGGRATLVIRSVLSPSFVSTGDVMVVVVDVEKSDFTHVMLTKYIETQGNNWARKTIKGNGKNWEAQLLLDSGSKYIAFGSVAKGDSIFLLSAAVHHLSSVNSDDPADYTKWNFRLSVGTITEGGDGAGKKKILWDTKDVTDRFQRDIEIRIKLWRLHVKRGFAFLMDDGTFVFAIMMHGGGNRNCFLIAYSKDPSSDLTINMDSAAEENEIIFPWGKSFFVVPGYFYYKSSKYMLRVSNDMGRTWEKYSGPLIKRLDNLKGEKFGFTPITIGKRRVLLFVVITEPDNSFREGACPPFEGPVNLYMFDDEHFQKVGSFFCDNRADTGGRFLYTNDELFFLYHRQYNSKPIHFTRLEKQLKKIKLLLEKWYPGDEEHAAGPAEPSVDVSESLKKLAGAKTSRKRKR